MPDRVLLALALPMLLTAPVLAVYANIGLPPSDPTALGLLVGIAAVSSLAGALAGAMLAHRVLRWFGIAILTVAIALYLDQALLTLRPLLGVTRDPTIALLILTSIVFVLYGLLALVQAKVSRIVFAGAAAVFASSLVSPVASVLADETRPRTLYIVLDELMGFSGFDESIAGAREARAVLEDVFLGHGFRLYENTFSRHLLTFRSLPAALNFEFSDDAPGDLSVHLSGHDPVALRGSALFDRFIAAGETIEIFQTRHFDFCAATEARCHTFASFDPVNPDIAFEPSVLSVLVGVARGFEGSLFWTMVTAGLSSHDPEGFAAVPEYYDLHAMGKWLDRVEAGIIASGADLVFAHLLTPHAPLIHDAQCAITSRTDRAYHLVEAMGLAPDFAEAVRVENYERYFGQVRCLAGRLEGMFEAILADPDYALGTIVVHGDHGSRLSMARYAENVTERDLVDNHAAFFAVRGPGTSPGLEPRLTSIQRLVTEYLSGEPLAALGADPPTLNVERVAGAGAAILPMPLPR